MKEEYLQSYDPEDIKMLLSNAIQRGWRGDVVVRIGEKGIFDVRVDLGIKPGERLPQ